MKANEPKYKFIVSAVLLMLAMIGLGLRLAFLHLGVSDKDRENVELSRRCEKTLDVRRGNIYDCHGDQNVLAMDLPVKNVCADPKIVARSNAASDVAMMLSEKLKISADEVAVRLRQSDRRYVALKRFVPNEEAENVVTGKLSGVFLEDAMMRFYPQKSFMCHVLGFVNNEGSGSSGVEQELDRYLKGCPGFLESQKNALKQELYTQRERYLPSVNGADVILNLDQNIQYIVEKTLDEVMVEHNAKAAWAIVGHVKTGRIMAMGSRPAFDLNEFKNADENVLLNRAIGIVYEPGSTFKMVTISAAINEKVVTPEVVVNCENGAWMYKGKILRDYHPYGDLNVADVIKKSSNIGTAKVALMMGDRMLYDYARAFGVGSKTGVDLPGEEGGILRPLSEWSSISSTRIAIGQGVAVTALQMLMIVSSIANDGFMMRPYVVSAVSRDKDALVRTQPEVLGRPISGETAAIMRNLLKSVTEDGGTGKGARVDGYEVAGKTGTAQKVIDGQYSSTAYVASFVGYLPADNPEIAVVVGVDEPQPYHTGGMVAAPVFSKIAGLTVRYLDILPDSERIAKK